MKLVEAFCRRLLRRQACQWHHQCGKKRKATHLGDLEAENSSRVLATLGRRVLIFEVLPLPFTGSVMVEVSNVLEVLRS